MVELSVPAGYMYCTVLTTDSSSIVVAGNHIRQIEHKPCTISSPPCYGQLSKENEVCLSPFTSGKSVSGDRGWVSRIPSYNRPGSSEVTS